MKRFGMAALVVMMGCVATFVHAADDSVFTDFEGKPHSIESYAGDGRWLVVMIWAHDCHVCNMEAENYAQFHEAHKDKDARILGISLDGQAKKAEAAAFIQRHDLPFPNLIGEPETTMLYYMNLTQTSFRGTPTILLYGPDGNLKAAQAGAVPVDSIEAYIAKNSPQAPKAG